MLHQFDEFLITMIDHGSPPIWKRPLTRSNADAPSNNQSRTGKPG
jgi:hypothetical protein